MCLWQRAIGRPHHILQGCQLHNPLRQRYLAIPFIFFFSTEVLGHAKSEHWSPRMKSIVFFRSSQRSPYSFSCRPSSPQILLQVLPAAHTVFSRSSQQPPQSSPCPPSSSLSYSLRSETCVQVWLHCVDLYKLGTAGEHVLALYSAPARTFICMWAFEPR